MNLSFVVSQTVSGGRMHNHRIWIIEDPMSTSHYELNVSGMTCGHCEKAVDKAIHQVDPQAVVNIERSTGKVRIESSQAREPLAQAIVAQGYGVAD
jgi:copper chaperone